MAYTAVVFKVMIASPSDVNPERNMIRQVLAEWNAVNADNRKVVLLPVGWETHSSPEMGDRPQAIINKQILKDCDLLVAVFWTRVGTATGEHVSGTVEEIEEHIKAGKPAMLYFSSAPHPDSVDQGQYQELKRFKESCKNRALLETYSDINDFKDKFNRQLQLKINSDEYFTVVSLPLSDAQSVLPSAIPDIPSLSREAQILLKEGSQDQKGYIIRMVHMGGMSVETNGKEFILDDGPKERATWEGAIEELESQDLIVDCGYKREVFRLTREGYEVASLIEI